MISEASIIITNGGNHPPEKYAFACAKRIINDLHADDPIAEAEAEVKIAKVLAVHHVEQRQLLSADLASDAANILKPFAYDVINTVVTDVIKAMSDSKWAKHFEDSVGYLTDVISQFFSVQDQTDKSWHADANPDCPHARQFRSAN